MMVLIAGLAPLLALARYPSAFGLVAFAGSIVLFVALCIRRRRYDLVAWLLILYPVLPLLVLYTHWNLAIRRIVRRSSMASLDSATPADTSVLSRTSRVSQSW